MSLKWGHTTPYCVNVRAFSHFSHILNINGRKLKIEQYTVLQYFSPKPLYEVKWSSSLQYLGNFSVKYVSLNWQTLKV